MTDIWNSIPEKYREGLLPNRAGEIEGLLRERDALREQMKVAASLQTHPAQINFLRDDDTVEVEVLDKVSGLLIVSVEMTFNEFAKAVLTTSTHFKAKATYRSLDKIGYVCEQCEKIITVPANLPIDELDRAVAAAKIVEPFAVDGWECNRLSDLWNSHRVVKYLKDGSRTAKVLFIRFVPPKTKGKSRT